MRRGQLVQLKDGKSGAPADKTYDPRDPQVQFRILTEANITNGFKQGWYPFSKALGRTGESFASELREVRNKWAHNGTFTDDDAYRALDTGERLLKLIGAAKDADEVHAIRLNLRRVTAEKDDKKTLKAAVDNPEAAGLKPWRDVLPPHHDVATGNFAASEFAPTSTRSPSAVNTIPATPMPSSSSAALPHRRSHRPRRPRRAPTGRRRQRTPVIQPADQLRWRQDALDAGAVACRGRIAGRTVPSRKPKNS